MKSILLTLLLLTSSIIYSQSGTIDPTFGNSGRVIMPAVEEGSLNVAYGTALQADGKIVTSGAGYIGIQVFAVTRSLTNGAPDPSFSDDGIVFITTMTRSSDTHSEAYGVAIAPDGKIIVVGETVDYVNRAPEYYSIVVRLNSDGTLDPTFSDDGIARLKLSDRFVSERLWGVTVQPDGKIVANGTSRLASFSDNHTLTVIRLNTDGSFDNEFGTAGIVRFDAGHISNGTRLDIQSNGKIVAIGSSFINEEFDGLIVRLNHNGTLDNSFDGDGARFIDIGADNFWEDVDAADNGKITVAGFAIADGSNNMDFTAAKLLNNGSFDNSFGTNGLKVIDQSQEDFVHAVDIDDEGRVILTGHSFEFDATLNGLANHIKVIRLLQNGNVDAVFASDGSYEDHFGNSALGFDAALQMDGKLVVAGFGSDGENSGRAITRIRMEGCEGQITGSFNDIVVLPAGIENNTLYIGYAPATSSDLQFTPDGNGNGYEYEWNSLNQNATFNLNPSNPAAIHVNASAEGTATIEVTVHDDNGCEATFAKNIIVSDVRCGNNMNKVLVCHVNKKDPSKSKTICISPNAVPAMLNNGSYLGTCASSENNRMSAEDITDTSPFLRVLNNPSRNEFTLQRSNINNCKLRVIDVSGRTIETRILHGSGNYSFGSAYAPGFYVAIIDHDGMSTVFKLVKN